MQDTEPENLWHRVSSRDALQFAWAKVQANKGSAGGDGVSLGAFASDLFGNISELRAELLAGSYRSGSFRKVSIPKRKPGYRILTIPAIRDRVVHTSIASALSPIFEAGFEDSSFGYRPGRGVVDAVEQIEKWRKRGFDTVIEADIVRYFDNVEHELLIDKVSATIEPMSGSAPVIELLGRLLQDQGKALGTPGLGIVQGSPLSPLLANIYLDALDEEIEQLGVKLVRYADDFVILCKSRKKARKVLDHCIDVLDQHGLKVHEGGTRIVKFDEGFDFVGYMFLRSLALKEKRQPDAAPSGKRPKSTVTEEGVIELGEDGSRFDPGKRVLYILDANRALTIRNRSFSVRRDDGTELIAIPHGRVGRIELSRDVDFDRGAVNLAIDTDTHLAMLDDFGQTRGQATTRPAIRAGLHLAQAKCLLDEGQRIEIARRIVEARIKNQRTQLMRLNRRPKKIEVEKPLVEMLRALRLVGKAKSIEQLLGNEGRATSLYWPAIGLLSELDAKNFRRRRPARDPLNAAINYLTGILERDVRAGIQAASLHTGFALLHGTRDRHEGLVFDLMEPFRAPLTEGLAVYLFTSRRLKAEQFDKFEDGTSRISSAGRKSLIEAYETAVSRRINKPDGGGKLAWRPMMRHQAFSLADAVVAQDPSRFSAYVMED